MEGWFADDPPRLLGRRCAACGTVAFPPTVQTCPNPGCDGEELTEHALSRTGTVWSYTTNHYEAPPPSVVPPPYTVAAVELDDERMVVLGLAPQPLRIGDKAQLALVTDLGTWAWVPA